ncbi:uncharacterized protein LOC106169054 [Lingula anatina]|uniref:Uncharacterized protein LOC106169054 n=1 Tax=Lingula anatina TaxID=7574 RepID=A0A1S3J1U8_LINAN|nr:uncharacterized protein LOC106169054 [Lingula anatina]|eukprot:XP_013403799.1 uncharacterized protein LOC106169054 [Lingula anatina]
MAKFHPPENLRFHAPNEWPEWRQRFIRYRQATKLDSEAGGIQVSALIYAMGKDAEHIFSTFKLSTADAMAENSEGEPEAENFDVVIAKFDEYFIPRRNIIHERARFRQRRQIPGESIETFYRNLVELSENCEFTNKEEEIRNAIVIGIADRDCSLKLQLKADLTLKTALEIVRSTELIKLQNSTNPSVANVSEVEKGNRQARGKPRGQNSQQRGQPRRCGQCNHILDRRHATCPAQNKKCNKCHRIGHFGVVCRSTRTFKSSASKQMGSVHEVIADDTDDVECFLGSLFTENSSNDSEWNVKLDMNGQSVDFKIDTGADTSVISKAMYESLKPSPTLSPTTVVLNSPGGKLTNIGKFVAKTKFKEKMYTFTVHVVRENVRNLLGRSACVDMGLVTRVLQADSVGTLKSDPVHIKLKDSAKPYSVSATRRVPAVAHKCTPNSKRHSQF